MNSVIHFDTSYNCGYMDTFQIISNFKLCEFDINCLVNLHVVKLYVVTYGDIAYNIWFLSSFMAMLYNNSKIKVC